ncbi:MAG: VWA domain-containing protein [Sedimentisphaerales bacterium]|nr:VWA domain-containing protein [Sedimentisphaerales bacterium]
MQRRIRAVLLCLLFLSVTGIALGLEEATPPAGRRDFVGELRQPEERAYHWMDVRLKTETAVDTKFGIYIFSREPITALWYKVQSIVDHSVAWVILDDQGIPVSDPLRIVQVLQSAQVICSTYDEARTHDRMDADLRRHPLLETVEKDYQNVMRQIITGLARGDPLWDAWNTLTGNYATRQREKVIDAYRRALVLLIPQASIAAPEMAAMPDAVNKIADGIAGAGLDAFRSGLGRTIADLQKAAESMNIAGPGAGSSLADWVKPHTEVHEPHTEYKASLPIGMLVPPPWASTGLAIGGPVDPPVTVIDTVRPPVGASLHPLCELNPGYMDRLKRFESQQNFINGMKRVHTWLLVAKGVTVAAAIYRAYQTQEALQWHNDELLFLGTCLRSHFETNAPGGLIGEAIPLALEDQREVTRRITDAVQEGAAPEVWSLASGEALEYLLSFTGTSPQLQWATASGVAIGFEAAKQAYKIEAVDDTLTVCMALSRIEEVAVDFYNRVQANAPAWTATTPPAPEVVANLLWCKRLASGAKGCFYLSLYELISDAENLSNAIMILFRTDEWLQRVGLFRTWTEQFLASANLPVPNNDLSSAQRTSLVEKYRSFLPGTGPHLNGVWRGKAYSQNSGTSEPSIYGDTIAHLDSREDGSFEGRLYIWWNPPWPSDKQPPPDPRKHDYDTIIGIRGRCTWSGKVYFTVDEVLDDKFWTEDKGWTGELSADGQELSGQLACGLPLTLRRVEPSSDQGKLDVVFCIDVSGSMIDDIEAVKSKVDEILAKFDERVRQDNISLHLGLVTYTQHDDQNWIQATPLTGNTQTIRNAIKGIQIVDLALGRRGNEDTYGAVMYAMNQLVGDQKIEMGWRGEKKGAAVQSQNPASTGTPINLGDAEGAAKIIITMGDEPQDEPDWEDRTLADVARVAENLDPVHIYPILLPKEGSGFLNTAVAAKKRIAEATGGQLITVNDAADLPDALVSTLQLTIRRHREEIWRRTHPPYLLYGMAAALAAVAVIALAGVLVVQLRQQQQPQ